ncbi:FHA domain-containing serine/threonine-protein kinase [Candidatus Uabimicrobium amorphum]|uniref:Serine/threonine protein kinase n=1 Tax=Uabimicrobium amorphum TaxID=2596890 RepID=A0A5S9ISD9_UABAM|nr:FHA domain-containing serine/threonine-protein kinase [Candidatus Uabimicrobium amorphum]BBM86280.1 serine/threonine protein kinase [Candidatus Uabimicrobium amorphum]
MSLSPKEISSLVDECLNNFLAAEQVKLALEKIDIHTGRIESSNTESIYLQNVIKYLCRHNRLEEWLNAVADDGFPFAERYLECITQMSSKDKQFGSYRIISRVGQGTIGNVYLAHDENGHRVTLKLITKEIVSKFSNKEELLQRFQRESNYAMLLNHPHIVRTVDSGNIDGNLYIASEYIVGKSLEDLLKDSSPLPVKQAVTIISDVLLGLEEISKNNLVHRNLKPSNILLSADGMAKIVDLGLLRSVSSDATLLTRTGNIMGTPAYMSPEQINAEKDIDIRTDLYSVGVIFYLCLCGDLPFQGSSALDIVEMHLKSPVPEPSVSINKKLLDFIRHLMEKDRSLRPASPKDALKILASIHEDPESTFAIGQLGTISRIPISVEKQAPDATYSGTGTIVTQNVLTPTSTASPLQSTKLVCEVEGVQHRLFVYAKDSLQIGRNSIEKEQQDICLRPLPAKGNEDGIRQISGKHFKIFVQNGSAYIQDLGSTVGTTLDGRQLIANEAVKLPALSTAVVANVIHLEISVIDNSPADTIGEIGSCRCEPSVFIRRKNNTPHHSYLLLVGKAALKWEDASFCAMEKGSNEILNVNNTLWLSGSVCGDGKAEPIGEGYSFSNQNSRFSFGVIRAEDQK